MKWGWDLNRSFKTLKIWALMRDNEMGSGQGYEPCRSLAELLGAGTFPLSSFGHSWDFLCLPWMHPVLMQPELH